MKKFLQFVFFVLSTIYYLQSTISLAHASWVEPQPPFSIEGNPDEDYQFDNIFPLFGFIRAPALEIYENQDRKRNYENLEVCGGKGGPKNARDERDYECSNDGDSCDGGDVELCRRGTGDGVRWEHSGPNGSCSVKGVSEKNPPGTKGTCSYDKVPSTLKKVKGTDFANTDSTIYDKLQSESGSYNNVGDDSNPITYGSQFLSNDSCEIAFHQILVVRRAKQTKNTLNETGEWPLGWVDWGYTTPNGKTLLEINEELPDSISSQMPSILQAIDNFYLSAGDPDNPVDISPKKARICDIVSQALAQSPPPTWASDLAQAPLYPPSWRQGFVRPSICVWDICCPGGRCKVEPKGVKRGLYYDNSISQTFGAALDVLFQTYSLDEGLALFKEIAIKNPLIRFATSASPNAIPSRITTMLNNELQSPCLIYTKYISWFSFGTQMDYIDPGDFFDQERKCPTWQIAPELSKQNAEAFFQSPLSAIIAMIWGQKQDEVDSVVYHTLTIPDAMGQSIQEIQQPSYDAVDTLDELTSVVDFNSNLSNTVDDGADYLYGGKTPFTSRRYFGLYPCADDMFSSQLDTSVKDYANGARVGCNQKSNTASGKCDGTKFAAIIADSSWQEPTSAATQVVLNSKMFVGGKLNPELEEVYAQVEEATGVPCEVLAGHHFEEASSCFTEPGMPDPEKCSGANGGPVGEQGGFLKTVDSAARSVLRYPITNTNRLITAMSYFNGGGNANCQSGFSGGTIPYSNCPRQFIGEDDPYVTNMLDAKHNSMYLLYCGDFLACTPPKPYGLDRPGAFAVALAVYNNATSQNSPSSTPPTTNPSSSPSTPISTGSSINPAGDCGTGYIDTALGCLPYERTEFIMALLRFITGIAGAIALVIMLIATIQIMTSAGNAKKLQSGRDLFFSAITGLLFLIFSVSLLRLFGADILKLPGFGR